MRPQSVTVCIEVQQSPDLRHHCVLKKHSIGRNSSTRGLFYVVNVLSYFKIVQLRKNSTTRGQCYVVNVLRYSLAATLFLPFPPSYAISSFFPPVKLFSPNKIALLPKQRRTFTIKNNPRVKLFSQLRYFEIAQDIYYKKQPPSYAISTYAMFFEDTMIAQVGGVLYMYCSQILKKTFKDGSLKSSTNTKICSCYGPLACILQADHNLNEL